MKNCKTCKHLSNDYLDECPAMMSALSFDLEEIGHGCARVVSVSIVDINTFGCILHEAAASEAEGGS